MPVQTETVKTLQSRGQVGKGRHLRDRFEPGAEFDVLEGFEVQGVGQGDAQFPLGPLHGDEGML